MILTNIKKKKKMKKIAINIIKNKHKSDPIRSFETIKKKKEKNEKKHKKSVVILQSIHHCAVYIVCPCWKFAEVAFFGGDE